MEASPQRVSIQVRSNSDLKGLISKVHGVFSNRELDLTSSGGIQGQNNNWYYLGERALGLSSPVVQKGVSVNLWSFAKCFQPKLIISFGLHMYTYTQRDLHVSLYMLAK